MPRISFAIRAAFLLAFTSALVGLAPPAAADSWSECTTEGASNTCSFTCTPGDRITVVADIWAYYPTVGSPTPTVTGTATCGGATATCTRTGYYWEVGGYQLSQTCSSASPQPALVGLGVAASCSINAVYGTGRATCFANSAIDVQDLESLYDGLAQQSVGAETPNATPPAGGSAVDTPAVGTPAVGPMASPGLDVPAVCSDPACATPIAYGPVATPGVNPPICDPLVLVCVGPVAPIVLVPAGQVPAACTVVPSACTAGPTLLPGGAVTTPPIPAVTLLGPQHLVVPAVGPVPLPFGGVGFSVAYEPEGLGVPAIGTTGYPPITTPGPVPVTVCASGCSVPTVSGNGALTVEAHAGGESIEQTVTV